VNTETLIKGYSPDWEERLGVGTCDEVYLLQARVHEIEASVAVERHEGISQLDYFLLKALALSNGTLEAMNDILHLGRQALRQFLTSHCAQGTVSTDDGVLFALTEKGRAAVESGTTVTTAVERRTFHFLDGSFTYISIQDGRGLRALNWATDWHFETAVLKDWIACDDNLKRAVGFPAEVRELVSPDNSGHATADRNASGPVSPHLIVDKACVIDAVLVIREEEEGTRSGNIYGLSHKGRPPSQKPTFSIEGATMLTSAFPALPDQGQPIAPNEVLRELVPREELKRAGVTAARWREDRVFVLGVRKDFVDANGVFIREALEESIRAYVPLGTDFVRVIRVSVEPADAEADRALRATCIALKLESSDNRNAVLEDQASFLSWMSGSAGTDGVEWPAVQEAAWRSKLHRLAYEISELEDMKDASLHG